MSPFSPGYSAAVKYTPGPNIGEMSGKQGNTVASHNRFGPYFRCRVKPINSRTLGQNNARNNFKSASQAWRVLTAAQQAAYRVAATSVVKFDRLGRQYTPTGPELYVSQCRNIYDYDPTAALPTAPPTAAAPAALLTATVTATSS